MWKPTQSQGVGSRHPLQQRPALLQHDPAHHWPIAPYTLNVGAYYENDGASVHVTATPFTQGIMQPEYTEAHSQLDLSASYTLPWFDGTMLEGSQISLDGLNLTGERIRSYIGSSNNPNNVYYPGTSFIIGFRGKL
jgi:hypothetical protein